MKALWLGLLLVACRAPATERESAPIASTVEPRIDLHVQDGFSELTVPQFEAWVGQARKSVTAFYGRFPVPVLRIEVARIAGSGLEDGVTTVADGIAVIRIDAGTDASVRTLARDWVLTHEMVHMAMPDLPIEHHWFEEGLATYIEPIARARAGFATEKSVWRQFVEGMPKGNPEAGDRGLDRTPTWGRTYWGGAIFCLLADIEIRTRTDGRLGLRDAVSGLVADGRSLLETSSIEDVLARCDAQVGVPVLSELYVAHATRPVVTDLDALWKRLGVVVSGRTLHFDETAPLAALRRAITQTGP